MDHNLAPTSGLEDASEEAGKLARVEKAVQPKAPLKTKADREIDSLSGYQGLGWLPYTLQFMLGVPSFLMRKMGLVKTSGWVRGVGNGLYDVLDNTTVADWHRVPGEFANAYANQNQIVGNTRPVGWLRRVAGRVNGGMAKVNDAVRGAFAPVRGGIGNFADSIQDNGFGKWLNGIFNWVAEKRGKKNHVKMAQEMGNLLETPTGVPLPFIKVGGQNLKDCKELEGLKKLVDEGKDLKGAEARAHMEKVATEAQRLIDEGRLSPPAADIAWKVKNGANKAIGYFEAAVAHEGAVGKGLRAVMKNFGKMGGRTSLLAATVTAAAALGVYVAAKTAQRDNHKDEATLKQLGDDLGDHNSPYLTQVKVVTKQNKLRHWGAAGANAAGDALMTTTMGPSGGGMSEFAVIGGGQMLLPQAGQMLVRENPVLNAYAALKAEERGEAPLSPDEKVKQVRQLVGNVPVVASRGGYYNRLAEPVAEAIVKKKLSVRETLRLINDPQQFTALASEVKASVDAAKAEAAKVKEQPVQPAAKVPGAAPMVAAKPSAIVSADRAYAGTLVGQNLALAQ